MPFSTTILQFPNKKNYYIFPLLSHFSTTHFLGKEYWKNLKGNHLQVPSTSFINLETRLSRRLRPKYRGWSCIFRSSTMWKNIFVLLLFQPFLPNLIPYYCHKNTE